MVTELISLAGGGVFGALMKMWAQAQKDRHEQQLHMMALRKQDGMLIQQARQYGQHDKPFSFTRRVIALSAVFSIIVLPKLVAAYCMIAEACGEASVWVSQQSTQPGFWFFTQSQDITEWVKLSGMFITPLDYHMVLAIVGLYFGGSIAKR